MLAYHRSEGGPWSQTPKAWLAQSMRRGGTNNVWPLMHSTDADPCSRRFGNLLKVWRYIRDVEQGHEQCSVLGRQAVMMAMGKFDASLALPSEASAEAGHSMQMVQLVAEQTGSPSSAGHAPQGFLQPQMCSKSPDLPVQQAACGPGKPCPAAPSTQISYTGHAEGVSPSSAEPGLMADPMVQVQRNDISQLISETQRLHMLPDPAPARGRRKADRRRLACTCLDPQEQPAGGVLDKASAKDTRNSLSAAAFGSMYCTNTYSLPAQEPVVSEGVEIKAPQSGQSNSKASCILSDWPCLVEKNWLSFLTLAASFQWRCLLLAL